MKPPHIYDGATPITHFSGDHAWLSNFSWVPAGITYEGMHFNTVEHAYQAAKTLDPVKRREIRAADKPSMAKLLGKRLRLRPDWEEVKVEVMLELLRQKFAPGTNYARLLVKTGEAELVEGNYWGDKFWGVDAKTGEGENVLGILLMAVRQELLIDMWETRPDAT